MDKKTKKIFAGAFIASFLLIFLPFLFVVMNLPAQGKFSGAEVSFLAQGAVIQAEIADTMARRARGLMGRESLPPGAGMLFVFNGEDKRGFWMKNTKMALDLFFISASGRVVDIKENFFPCVEDSCPVYESSAPAKYVLETNAGMAHEKKIRKGELVKINWK